MMRQGRDVRAIICVLVCMSFVCCVAKVDEVQHLDTLAYTEDEIGIQGNWIKKHEWMQSAQELISEMDQTLVDFQEYDATFYQKSYAEIDADLNAFYEKIGVGSSAVEALFLDVEKDLTDTLNKRLEVVKNPNARQRDTEQQAFDLERELQRTKASVEQLKADMKLVADFDQAINGRRAKVQEQIAAAQHAKQDAEKLFDKMRYIIDDLKARAVFYQIKGVVGQLEAMLVFFKADLAQDTTTLIAKTKEQIAHTQQGIIQLEEKGAVILNRAAVLEALKAKQEQEQEVVAPVEHTPKPERIQRQTMMQSWVSAGKFLWQAVCESLSDLWQQLCGLVGLSAHKKTRERTTETASDTKDAETKKTEATPQEKESSEPTAAGGVGIASDAKKETESKEE